MMGLVGGRDLAPGGFLELLAQAGLVVFALAWLAVGWSLLAAQPEEGVLGTVNS
jgi:hypothetical protein